MDDAVERAAAAAFPDRRVASIDPAGLSWNPGNGSAKVSFADGETAYLKVATDGDPSRIVTERAAIDYVAANRPVPVPTVLASAADGPAPYLATAPLVGRSPAGDWADRGTDERAAVARDVGAALAALHAERFDAHGRIVGGGRDGLELETAPWTDVLVATLRRLESLAPSERFPDAFDEVIAAVRANREDLDRAPAALLHGDPAKPNTFCRADGVGFIDWEIAHVGDPARELYRVRDQALDGLREPAADPVVSALHDGYRSVTGGLPEGYERRRPVYEAVRFLGVVGFFENVVDYRPESAAELAAWAEAEFERTLAAIE